ncbi:hypothetical protein [Dyella sp. 333MFSha]|uniref:hypothetical protein n=1 Tax=Dyella sp. 333MFSha TaxID=1798240 RepID=UPI000885F4F0|nr:hypothetical protein [Dyella sp. 333MFSha]SDG49970.1 hypothetical protein SAMN04515659_2925 [Dyella sp. 333MFSha]
MDVSFHRQLADTLRSSLGVEVGMTAWSGAASLPVVLRKETEFAEANIRGLAVVFMRSVGDDLRSSGDVLSRLARVAEAAGAPVVYVANVLPAHRRSALIAQGVPFVVPGRYVHLPDVGVDWRKHARQKRAAAAHASGRGMLEASAQALLIAGLLNTPEKSFSPYDRGLELGYTRMTVGRACRSLIEAGLFEPQRRGTSLLLTSVGSSRDVWFRAMPLLKSPVRASLTVAGHVSLESSLPWSGESALAEWSSLNPPRIPVRALGPAEQKELFAAYRVTNFRSLSARLNHDDIEKADAWRLESWAYPATARAAGGRADPLSVWLSLRDAAVDDPRLESALEQLMERLDWL